MGNRKASPTGGPRTGYPAGPREPQAPAPCLSCMGSAALGSGGLSKLWRLRWDSGWRPWRSGTRAASPGTTAGRLQSQLEPSHPAGHPPLQRAPLVPCRAGRCPLPSLRHPLPPPPPSHPQSFLPGGAHGLRAVLPWPPSAPVQHVHSLTSLLAHQPLLETPDGTRASPSTRPATLQDCPSRGL